MIKWLLFLILTCAGGIVYAQVPHCQGVATCALSSAIPANGTIAVFGSTAAAAPTDTLGDTYSAGPTFTYTDSTFGSITIHTYYTHNGSNTGTPTIAVASGAGFAARFYASSQVVNTGNPFDKNCGASPAVPNAGSGTLTGCSIQSTQTNGPFNMFGIAVNTGGGTGITIGTPSFPSTMNNGVGANTYRTSWDTVDSGFNFVNSGAPQTGTPTFSFTNSGGAGGTFGVMEVTLLSGQTAASSQSYVQIIKYNPQRDSVPKFKPELIFTVLRRWQRPCEPIRFL